jgi:hypothetical protein
MKPIKRWQESVCATLVAGILSLPLGVGAVTLTSAPAYAQTALSLSQASAIEASLTAAIQAAKGDPTLIEAAISQALVNGISLYGPDAASAVTAAVMTAAEDAHVSQFEIGAGLADGAATIASTNLTAAQTIASTVANEGRSGEIRSFESTSTSLGYSNLASLAGAGATTTGETGGTAGGGLTGGGNLGNAFSGGFNGGGGGAGGGGGCLNPSCTKL